MKVFLSVWAILMLAMLAGLVLALRDTIWPDVVRAMILEFKDRGNRYGQRC